MKRCPCKINEDIFCRTGIIYNFLISILTFKLSRYFDIIGLPDGHLSWLSLELWKLRILHELLWINTKWTEFQIKQSHYVHMTYLFMVRFLKCKALQKAWNVFNLIKDDLIHYWVVHNLNTLHINIIVNDPKSIFLD